MFAGVSQSGWKERNHFRLLLREVGWGIVYGVHWPLGI